MRYNLDRNIRGNKSKSTNQAATRLRSAAERGLISTRVIVLGQSHRLDLLAFKYLGTPTLWWAIAALSNIGWAMQLPPNTRLVVPTSREQIEDLF
tara:strand:+ start:853 stop:1137 length:285 start_codon:yes stop_codon:yes gene_type:complete